MQKGGHGNNFFVQSHRCPTMSNPQVPLPTIPVEFQELKDAKLDTLEQLEMNQTALEDFISHMAIVQNYTKAREETELKTRDLADANITAHQKLVACQSEIDEVAKALEDVRTRVEVSFSERDALMSKFTPKHLLKDLDAIAGKTDQETERILSEFTTLETAKAAILSQRSLHHKARALADLISSHGSRALSPRSDLRQ